MGIAVSVLYHTILTGGFRRGGRAGRGSCGCSGGRGSSGGGGTSGGGLVFETLRRAVRAYGVFGLARLELLACRHVRAADRAEHRSDQHAIHPIVDSAVLRRPSVCHGRFGIGATHVDAANVHLPHAWLDRGNAEILNETIGGEVIGTVVGLGEKQHAKNVLGKSKEGSDRS